MVTVLIDDDAPSASNILVSTSVGQIDANGYVWDPINPLTVYVTVTDEQDRGDEVTLHYWREGIDDPTQMVKHKRKNTKPKPSHSSLYVAARNRLLSQISQCLETDSMARSVCG